MVKEVKYTVLESLISPEKRIYAGIMAKDKRGRGIWKTRCDVTPQVINAFLGHYAAKAKTENPDGKGMRYEYKDVEGYDVVIKLTKKNNETTHQTSAQTQENEPIDEQVGY